MVPSMASTPVEWIYHKLFRSEIDPTVSDGFGVEGSGESSHLHSIHHNSYESMEMAAIPSPSIFGAKKRRDRLKNGVEK